MNKKNKFKLLTTFIIIFALIVSFIPTSHADAGRIKVYNKTGAPIIVTWSGTGCLGEDVKLSIVCAYAILKNHQMSDYAYPWGVTTTWLNIGVAGKGTGNKKNTHPCSFSAGSSLSQFCLFDHFVVETDAWKIDECTIYREIDDYEVICRRL